MCVRRHLLIIVVAAACSLAAAVSCSKTELSAGDGRYGGDSTIEQQQENITEQQMEQAMFIPGEAIVQFTEEMTLRIEALEGLEPTKASPGLAALQSALGISSMERLFPEAGQWEERTRREGLHRFYKVTFDAEVPVTKARAGFEGIDGVESFEGHRRKRCLAASPNDPLWSRLWGLNSAVSANYNINVEKLWPYTKGNPNVVVCVVDEGIQQDHPDLQWNLGSDNYNFVKKSSTILGGDHGCHVAGTIAGVTNNSVGVAGIAGGDYAENSRGVTLISAQIFLGENGTGSSASAIKWGADHGAVISQNSWGYSFDANGDGNLSGSELTNALEATIDKSDKAAVDYFIKYAGCDNNGEQLSSSPMKGGVVIFAAGNDGISNGAPANYAPIVAVGAVGSDGSLCDFSNYGDWVDICAPGQNICSTVSGSKFDSYSGTSMACPHVSGVAALLLSYAGGTGFTADRLQSVLVGGARSSYIKYNSRSCGPYLDAWGSFRLLKKEDNKDPLIETDYTSDFVFRHHESVSIPFHIYDPDGDALDVTYSTDGSAKLSSAGADMWNFTLLCELVTDSREHPFTITAKDPGGAVATAQFSYKVLPNNAPVSNFSPSDTLIQVGDSFRVELSGMFSDPDGEELKYTVSSSSSAVSAKLSGTTVELNGISQDLATILLSASDHMGLKATTSFKVLSRTDKNSFEVYPNPVVDCLKIRTGETEESVGVRLVSSTGVLVLEDKVNCSAFKPGELSFAPYAPGIYMLEITRSGVTSSMTIVKK